MALLTYEYHDLGCDAVDDGKICQEFFTGTPGKPAHQVRSDARQVGWSLADCNVVERLKDFCPKHKDRS